MRATSVCSIAFGLAVIPGKIFAATRDGSMSFHQMHCTDGGRLRQQRVCETCNEVVPFADIAKGLDVGTDNPIMVSDEDLASLPLPVSKVIEVLAFVPTGQVDPLMLGKGYNFEPAVVGLKAYRLLHAAMVRSGRVAIARFVIRSKESLMVLRAIEGGMVTVQTMAWPDDVQPATFPVLARTVALSDAEVGAADALVDALASDFTPSVYRDEYRSALVELVAARAAGVDVPAPRAAVASSPADDLLHMLTASLKEVQDGRTLPIAS